MSNTNTTPDKKDGATFSGRRIRLLNIIYDDVNNPWLGGGGAMRAYEMYKRFPRNVEVTLLTGRYPKAKRAESISENFTCKRVGLPWSYTVSRITFALSIPFYLLTHKDYDMVIDEHSSFSPAFSFFYTKRPVIGYFQNIHSQKSVEGKGFFKTFFAKIFDKIAFRYFKRYVTVSTSFIKMVEERARHKDNIRLVHNGVSEEFFNVNKTERDYILFFGRIEIYQKGIDTLLEAYSELRDKPKLVIAGGGIDEDKVRLTVKKLGLQNVQFIGRYSHKQACELLSGAVCVVMPSRFESFGITALEAMASGTAFIGSKIPGLQDVVADCGMLVEPENPHGLAEAMERMVKDAALRRSFEEKGRIRARSFMWEQVSKDLLDVLADAVNGR